MPRHPPTCEDAMHTMYQPSRRRKYVERLRTTFKTMKLHFLSALLFVAFTACDTKVSVPPAEHNTTIVNPPAEKKETTIVNPPAEKKTETTTTTGPAGTTVEKKTETNR
jgi:hypothetical protein